ncbi:MAG: ABC transporter permease [Dehalococcoidia bacterium]|nr:ABC transporter permease [Dehalococcoidia bacterium]
MATQTTAGALRTERRPNAVSTAFTKTIKFCKRNPLGAFAGFLCLFTLVCALGGWTGVLLTHNPEVFRGADRLLGYFGESKVGQGTYILGTDDLGRDMWSRLIKGAQLSVFFGLGVATIAIVLGGVIGLVSAYFGGWADLIVQRIVDLVQTIPLLVLAIAVVSVTGPGIMKGFWILAFLSIPRPVRVIRGSVLSVKQETYVEAARSLGATSNRIMWKHVLPNVTAPMIVLASYLIAVAIVVEASLSFLGIGAQPPTPSWGAMLTGSGNLFFQTNPRLALLPGLAISVLVFATNMFGDAVRDELDPRLRGTR